MLQYCEEKRIPKSPRDGSMHAYAVTTVYNVHHRSVSFLHFRMQTKEEYDKEPHMCKAEAVLHAMYTSDAGFGLFFHCARFNNMFISSCRRWSWVQLACLPYRSQH